MSLRLFRITQFAESRQLTPLMQRYSMHPYVMMVLLSGWIASVCNFSLWQAVSHLPEPSHGSVFTMGLALFAAIVCALVTMMSLFNWRYVFKPAMTLVLLLVSMNTYVMFQEGSFIHLEMLRRLFSAPVPLLKSLFNWTFLWCLVVIFAAPNMYLWQCRLRRYSVLDSLRLNLTGITFALLTLLCLVVWRYQSLSSLVLKNPALRALINPINLGWNFYTL